MEFIKDMLNRNYSLKYVSVKYNIPEENLLDEFLKQKRQYTQQEINKVMEEVYYI